MPIFRKLEEEESPRVPGMITEVGGGLGNVVWCSRGDKYSAVLKLERLGELEEEIQMIRLVSSSPMAESRYIKK